MYEYLEEHAYISKNKRSNYQFELSKTRAECIANKYNSLCEEKDKEIERLKKREQECIDHYLVQCKYASEMEDKYITASKEIERLNNIINELEKYLIEQVEKSYSNDYDNVLDKLDELTGSESNE